MKKNNKHTSTEALLKRFKELLQAYLQVSIVQLVAHKSKKDAGGLKW